MANDNELEFRKRHEALRKEVQDIRNFMNSKVLSDYFWEWYPKDDEETRRQKREWAQDLREVSEKINELVERLEREAE